jgi:hypothetical protein
VGFGASNGLIAFLMAFSGSKRGMWFPQGLLLDAQRGLVWCSRVALVAESDVDVRGCLEHRAFFVVLTLLGLAV